MKKILFIIALAFAGIVSANAQTRVIVRTPVRRVTVVRRPAVVVAPVRRVVIRPAAGAVVVRPAVAAVVVRPVVRRRVVIVRP